MAREDLCESLSALLNFCEEESAKEADSLADVGQPRRPPAYLAIGQFSYRTAASM
ncbi:hypothetical protein [Litorimonas haliclonae]|uniref:hypothetical protein n=1 Tax=Litorimonas haliclonae TaxID=2081977 RepID=UPI0039EE11C0